MAKQAVHHATRRLNETEFDRRFPKCPPKLRALIEKHSWVISGLSKKTGVTNGAIRRIASGEEVKPATAKRLGLTPEEMDAKPEKHPTVSDAAEFDKKYPKCPKPVRDLVEQAGWKFFTATKNARMGFDSLKKAAETGKMSPRVQRNVERALSGERVAVTSANSTTTSIIIFRASSFEKLYDIAIHLGGEWKFKKHLGSSWLAVLKMPSRDLVAYLAMVRSYDAEVIPV